MCWIQRDVEHRETLDTDVRDTDVWNAESVSIENRRIEGALGRQLILPPE